MPSVALVVIAKNEERSIGRLLESATRLVDEIIVVDTGSHDNTIEIARAAGARVSHLDWIDDFSAARNSALELTNAPWRLVLDADEWIAPETNDIREICNREDKFVGRVNISNSFNADIAGRRQVLKSRDWISRLLPIGVRYVGVIHEQPRHDLPIRNVPIYVLHDGYEDAQLQLKGDRNLLLLEQLMASGCDDEYYRYQYAKELIRKARFEDAAAQLTIVLSRIAGAAPWREEAVCSALQSFGNSEWFDIGVELIENERTRYSASTDFWFCVGCFYIELARAAPQIGGQALELIELSFLRCIKIGEHETKSKVVGRGSFLAAQNLYAFYVATHQPDKANRFKRLANEPAHHSASHDSASHENHW